MITSMFSAAWDVWVAGAFTPIPAVTIRRKTQTPRVKGQYYSSFSQYFDVLSHFPPLLRSEFRMKFDMNIPLLDNALYIAKQGYHKKRYMSEDVL